MPLKLLGKIRATTEGSWALFDGMTPALQQGSGLPVTDGTNTPATDRAVYY